MNVPLVLRMPLSPVERRQWLEQQLLTTSLPRLVRELQIVCVAGPDFQQSNCFQNGYAPTLAECFSSSQEFENILLHGLMDLDDSTLRQLLRNPSLLIELQERVIQCGGDYWFSIRPGKSKTLQPKDSGWRFPASLALAASLFLICIWELNAWSPGSQVFGWGTNRLALNDLENLKSRELFQKLADASESWFGKRPSDVASFTQRCDTFSLGCEQIGNLILPQLARQQNARLSLYCSETQRRLEQLAKNALSGDLTLKNALTSADQAIRKLIHNLQAEAANSA